MSRLGRAFAGALALVALSTLIKPWPALAEPATAAQDTCPRADQPAVRTVDLNTADEEALLALPGIGPARARAIVAYRAARGGFRSVSELLSIKGIGRALLRELRPLVTLSAPRR